MFDTSSPLQGTFVGAQGAGAPGCDVILFLIPPEGGTGFSN